MVKSVLWMEHAPLTQEHQLSAKAAETFQVTVVPTQSVSLTMRLQAVRQTTARPHVEPTSTVQAGMKAVAAFKSSTLTSRAAAMRIAALASSALEVPKDKTHSAPAQQMQTVRPTSAFQTSLAAVVAPVRALGFRATRMLTVALPAPRLHRPLMGNPLRFVKQTLALAVKKQVSPVKTFLAKPSAQNSNHEWRRVFRPDAVGSS